MTTIDTVAAALIAAHKDGKRADPAALPVPDFAEALEIQRRVQAQVGPVAGFKVARRPEGAPIMAPIPAGRIFDSGADIPVRDRMGIELEIGFELLADPRPDPMADPATFFRPRLVLELVDTRIDGEDLDPMLKLADMQINDGLVVGPALSDWDGSDFGTVTASLIAGSETVIDGPATIPGGSALANLGLLCAHVGDHCGGLAKGQIIITGSLCGLPYFSSGTAISGRIEGFGDIACQLV